MSAPNNLQTYSSALTECKTFESVDNELTQMETTIPRRRLFLAESHPPPTTYLRETKKARLEAMQPLYFWFVDQEAFSWE